MATPHIQPAPLAPQYLDHASNLVVMPEDHATAIAHVRDALEALCWLGDELASANIRSRQAGIAAGCEVAMRPEAFSGLLRVLGERLEGIEGLPSVSMLLRQRPDLCDKRSPK